MPVVFVGVTALVLPTQRDHSADADIGLGLLVPHPRPFRWWILFYFTDHYFIIYHHGLLSFGNPYGRQCFLAEGILLSSLPFFFSFHFGLDVPFDC